MAQLNSLKELGKILSDIGIKATCPHCKERYLLIRHRICPDCKDAECKKCGYLICGGCENNIINT